MRTLETLQSHDDLLNENAEEAHNLHHNMQSPNTILYENAEEAHNLHHNLQSPDGLLNENAEEVHNLQWKMCSWRPSELGLLDENLSIICNFLTKNCEKKSIGATIRIGQEIRCLPYAGFFTDRQINKQTDRHGG